MNWNALLPWGAGVALLLLLFGWALKQSREPGWLAFKWLVTAVAIGGIGFLFHKLLGGGGGWAAGIALGLGAAVFGLVLALVWTRSVVTGMTAPLLRLFYDERQEIEPTPLYSQAEALRKKGRYQEACLEVEAQLARFPKDLTGILMLAGIQAVDLKNLAAAERILENFMRSTSAANSVVVLNQIADWRLTWPTMSTARVRRWNAFARSVRRPRLPTWPASDWLT